MTDATARTPPPSPSPMPRMEQWGLRYLRTLPVTAIAGADAVVHVLNDAERAELRRITRGAVTRAAVAGALSGLLCALAAIFAGAQHADATAHAPSVATVARYWGAVGAVTVIASIAEIAFLSWDALRSVGRLAGAAGLELRVSDDDGARMSVGAALVRAALELPNPPDLVHGLDPLREASKWRIALASLIYKAKVAVTGVLTKLLVRRALGRAATRAVLELLAVPVTAVWDALVCWWILREARLRVLGPSAAEEFLRIVAPDPKQLDPGSREVCVRAVACAVVRTQDLHPNLLGLLLATQRHVELEARALGSLAIDDTARFLALLGSLDRDTQTLALRTLAVASIIDGRLAAAERVLLREAFARCNRALDEATVEALRRDLTRGRAISPQRVRSIA